MTYANCRAIFSLSGCNLLPPQTCDINKADHPPSPLSVALQVNNSWGSQQFAISPPHFPFAMQRFAILPIKLPEQQMSSAPPPAPSSGQRQRTKGSAISRIPNRIRIQNPKSQLQFNSTDSTHSQTRTDSTHWISRKFNWAFKDALTRATAGAVAVIGPKNAGSGWNRVPSWGVREEPGGE